MEIAVALVILAAVSALSYQMLIRAQHAFQSQRDLVETQQNARMAMETITSDLRQISFNKEPTQPSVVFAGIDSIVFTADLFDSIPGAEQVSIYLASTLDSGTANPSDRIVFRSVHDTTGLEVLRGPIAYGVADSGLTFQYFDRDGASMNFPIVQPEHVSEVEVAVTTQTAHPDPESGYMDVTTTTTVFPRNLPFTPPMPRPESPGCGSLNSPNCESLTLSWTVPTLNTDGSELKFNDISHYSIYYGTSTDSMKLDTRIARNMEMWTVKNLIGGNHYYMDVTVTSLGGVESFPCRRNGMVGSSAPPKAPGNMVGGGGIGAVTVQWAPVTLDTLDNTITAEVSYSVYRSLTPGFTPTPSDLQAGCLIDTFYTDFVSDSCITFHYVVAAEACGLEGGFSNELMISLPAPPSCPGEVYAIEGIANGVIVAGWMPPTTRTDGSSLGGAVSGYRVFYSLLSGVYTDSVDVGHTMMLYAINDLEDCSTYFVNVAAIDNCGTRGVLCPGLEAAARTSAPCNEYVPIPITSLSAVGGDQRIDLNWPANRTDCDLDGYLVHYGRYSGSYYGTEALQGPSPVFVDAADAQVDTASAAFSLTGLEACVEYYVSVQCVDVCDPPLASEGNPEAYDMTFCGSCDLIKACVTEVAEGTMQEQLRYQIGNDGDVDVTVEEMELTWNSGSNLMEILVGSTPVWNSIGVGDPTGPQTSPASIDVNDFGVNDDEDFGNPKEITLVFDGTVTGDVVDVSYRTNEGSCTTTLSPCGVLFTEDFTGSDGAPPGWTPRTGSSWTLSSNRLKTTSSGRITPDALGFSYGDYMVTMDVYLDNGSSGRRAGLYSRYNDTGNYYLLRMYPGYDLLQFCRKVDYGGLITLGSTYNFDIDNDIWYTMSISAYGNTFRCWFDGQLVDWDGATGTVITDTGLETGNISPYAWDVSKVYFDNVQVEPTCGCGGVVP